MKIYIEQFGHEREFSKFCTQTHKDATSSELVTTSFYVARATHAERRKGKLPLRRDVALKKEPKFKDTPVAVEEPFLVARFVDGIAANLVCCPDVIDLFAYTDISNRVPAATDEELYNPLPGEVRYQLHMSVSDVATLVPEAKE